MVAWFRDVQVNNKANSFVRVLVDEKVRALWRKVQCCSVLDVQMDAVAVQVNCDPSVGD